MALLVQSSTFPNKPHLLSFKTLPTKPRFTIFCLGSSSSSSSSSESQSSKSANNTDPIDQSSDKKPISSTGQGFGSTQLPKPSSSSNGKKKGRKERASIIRRNPVEKPAFSGNKTGVEKDSQQGVNERAFLLTWLGLGCVILVEGIVLASSGFLPEEWDKFLVKYLYPSFTPTVFLFVAGTVVYGVQKYLQNENLNDGK